MCRPPSGECRGDNRLKWGNIQTTKVETGILRKYPLSLHRRVGDFDKLRPLGKNGSTNLKTSISCETSVRRIQALSIHW